MHRWNEDVIVTSHSSSQATAMSINSSGKLAVLGSKRHLTVIDLDHPKAVKHRISLNSKYDLSQVLWNPLLSHRQLLLTTYSQWADVWQFADDGTGQKLASMQGHTRAISDVDWSIAHPNMMATCSLDAYICLWDIREAKRAKLSMSTVVGASQVKWNKLNDYNIASAHDGNVRIWDIRSTKSPVQYIMAHVSKIYSLDWSPMEENTLVSASQDASMCFWDISESGTSPTHRINVGCPVWRVQYTPMQNSVLSVAYKSFRETPISIWDLSGHGDKQLVQSYNGHNDVLLDFQWRKMTEHKMWQLVTWSKDQILRLWQPNFNYRSLSPCGNDNNENDTNSDSSVKTVSTSPCNTTNTLTVPALSGPLANPKLRPAHEQPNELIIPSEMIVKRFQTIHEVDVRHSLDEEFKVQYVDIPYIRIEDTDLLERSCCILIQSQQHQLGLLIKFPRDYPYQVQPVFEFTTKSSSSELLRLQCNLLHCVEDTAKAYVKTGKGCLEPCLRRLSNEVAGLVNARMGADMGQQKRKLHTFTFDKFNDLLNVPFPRTCGASFGGAGLLVVFSRPPHLKGFQSSSERTPKSIASLLTYRNMTSGAQAQKHELYFGSSPSSYQTGISVSSFYYKGKKARKSHKMANTLAPTGPDSRKHSRLLQSCNRVTILDTANVSTFSRTLAQNYVIPLPTASAQQRQDACAHNQQQASDEGFDDLARVWACVKVMPQHASPPCNEFAPPFATSPAGKACVAEILAHYGRLKDVQTLAMVSHCLKQKGTASGHGHGDAAQTDGQTMSRSVSDSKYFEAGRLSRIVADVRPIRHSRTANNSAGCKTPIRSSPSAGEGERPTLLVDVVTSTVDEAQRRWRQDAQIWPERGAFKEAEFLRAYGDLLHRMRCDVKKMELRKGADDSSTLRDQIRVSDSAAKGVTCAICQLRVSHQLALCASCTHGGHPAHMSEWFAAYQQCPSPLCECRCANLSQKL